MCLLTTINTTAMSTLFQRALTTIVLSWSCQNVRILINDTLSTNFVHENEEKIPVSQQYFLSLSSHLLLYFSTVFSLLSQPSRTQWRYLGKENNMDAFLHVAGDEDKVQDVPTFSKHEW